MTVQTLPIPPFFDPARVKELWHVPYLDRQQEAIDWAKRYGVKPAATDAFRLAVLLIDCQGTFCLPEGNLFVAGRSGTGAIDDNVRLCEFIYRNLDVITELAPTMDTHRAFQIFCPAFWIDQDGNHPAPMTVISVADVEKGVWTVNPGVASSVAGGDYVGLQRHALHYVKTLEATGKYPLIIWPYHGMLGGIGHALVSSIEEACFFHTIARWSQTSFEVKGGNFLTENYSVLAPEVTTGPDGSPIDQKNTRFIERLLKFDAVAIAGQAKSHCVAWTISDLLDNMGGDRSLAEKVYLLEDCTSPVVVPNVVDYTQEADDAFARFEGAGMHVVKSTDPIDSWPGIGL